MKSLEHYGPVVNPDTGEPFRPLGVGSLIVPPAVWIDEDDDALLWEVNESKTGLIYNWKVARPTNRLLLGFVNLDSDNKILAYAQKWGMLGLQPDKQSFALGPDLRPDATGGWEPLALWRDCSKQARALLTIAEILKDGKPASVEQWKDVVGYNTDYIASVIKKKRESLESQRREVARVIDYYWLGLGKVRPVFLWQTSPDNPGALPKVVLAADQPLHSFALYALLAVQLMFAVSGARRWGTCYHCGEIYQPTGRAPKRGQRSFCSECRDKGIPKRLARETYERVRSPKKRQRK